PVPGETVANGGNRLTRATEPAGRYLQFSYATANGPRISQVAGSDGRVVQYHYYYGFALDQVTYYGNANWIARYTYVGANVGDPNTMPQLLKTCDDPMYSGPMKRISYEYKTGTNADGTQAVYGQVWKVRYWNGNGGQENSGPVVCTLTVGEAPSNHVKRKETRGDGATRT